LFRVKVRYRLAETKAWLEGRKNKARDCRRRVVVLGEAKIEKEEEKIKIQVQSGKEAGGY